MLFTKRVQSKIREGGYFTRHVRKLGAIVTVRASEKLYESPKKTVSCMLRPRYTARTSLTLNK